MVTINEIKNKIRRAGLAGKNICIHSSYKSFGGVEGGPRSIIDAFIGNDCTIMVPTFSYGYLLNPNDNNRPARNAWDYTVKDDLYERNYDNVFSCNSDEIDSDMGIIPRTIITMPLRKRGYHPLDSFTAVGKNAAALVESQTPTDVYAPLKRLIETDGYVVLMGVDFESMTLIHHCEKEAGRNMFIRWAWSQDGTDGTMIPVEIGGCSSGFNNLSGALEAAVMRITVGKSEWMILHAPTAFEAAKKAIMDDPHITHCGDHACVECNDAVAGGPYYT